MENRIKIKLGTSDKVILGIGYTLLGLFVLAIAIPLVYVVIASFMDPNVLNNQGISFNFKDWTIDAYRRVLENDMIWRGFANSLFYSAAFTLISVFITLLAAYPMSKKEFVGRGFFNVIFVITMFFNGGTVPTYCMIAAYGLVDSFWVLILPGALSPWNLILLVNFFRNVPNEMLEAAEIEGAGDYRILLQIVLPVSLPIIATITLLSVVGHWNNWFDAYLYMNNSSKWPLQTYIYNIMVTHKF